MFVCGRIVGRIEKAQSRIYFPFDLPAEHSKRRAYFSKRLASEGCLFHVPLRRQARVTCARSRFPYWAYMPNGRCAIGQRPQRKRQSRQTTASPSPLSQTTSIIGGISSLFCIVMHNQSINSQSQSENQKPSALRDSPFRGATDCIALSIKTPAYRRYPKLTSEHRQESAPFCFDFSIIAS